MSFICPPLNVFPVCGWVRHVLWTAMCLFFCFLGGFFAYMHVQVRFEIYVTRNNHNLHPQWLEFCLNLWCSLTNTQYSTRVDVNGTCWEATRANSWHFRGTSCSYESLNCQVLSEMNKRGSSLTIICCFPHARIPETSLKFIIYGAAAIKHKVHIAFKAAKYPFKCK